MQKFIYQYLKTKLAQLTELEGRPEKWDAELDRISRWLAEEIYSYNDFFSRTDERGVISRLDRIEELLKRDKPEDVGICRWRQEGEDREILKLIVMGAPASKKGLVNAEEKKVGRTFAANVLQNWFKEANQATIIDPFIFKRSQPKDRKEEDKEKADLDASHAQAILDILGTKDIVSFYCKSGKISAGVASYINLNARNKIKEVVFYKVDDLHDRVWVRKVQNEGASAKVLGTSFDGIGKRPTYLIDMPEADLPVYMNYVRGLEKVALESTDKL